MRLSSLENRKACKQGTLKELFQRQASADSPIKLQTAVECATAHTATERTTNQTAVGHSDTTATQCATNETAVEHTTVNAAVEQATSPTDMATCPVCNQLVSAENSVFNQHIDECLNCLAIKETLSSDSISMHQSNMDDFSSVSPLQATPSPFKLQGSDGHCYPTHDSMNSSQSLAHSNSRKRRASVSTAHKAAKRLTLEHYFNSPCK